MYVLEKVINEDHIVVSGEEYVSNISTGSCSGCEFDYEGSIEGLCLDLCTAMSRQDEKEVVFSKKQTAHEYKAQYDFMPLLSAWNTPGVSITQ